MWNVKRVITITFIAGLTAMTACTKNNPEQAAIDPNAAPVAVADPAAAPNPSAPTPEGFAAATSKETAATSPTLAPIKPYRTFITLQRYTLERSGFPAGSISNVKLEITFPNGGKLQLPDAGQYWPIGDGQVQEINRTYEVPFPYLQKDGFKFTVQMVRKGNLMEPCHFDVAQLSEFNRSYICKTDLGWQTQQGIREEKMAIEGVQVRVFTDKNSPANEVPRDAMITSAKP